MLVYFLPLAINLLLSDCNARKFQTKGNLIKPVYQKLLFELKGRSQATLQFSKSAMWHRVRNKSNCVGDSLVCLLKSFQVVQMDKKRKKKNLQCHSRFNLFWFFLLVQPSSGDLPGVWHHERAILPAHYEMGQRCRWGASVTNGSFTISGLLVCITMIHFLILPTTLWFLSVFFPSCTDAHIRLSL